MQILDSLGTWPVVALPTGLANTNTGILIADWLPLVSMVACVPTLHLYYTSRRWTDLAVFSVGFILAAVYHICHIHEEGLQQSSLFGISGPLWRTFDILCAQYLLGRTFSHAIGASHWLTHVLANTVFPAVCVYYLWTATEALPMQNIVHTLLAVMLASLAAKLVLEGVDTLPKYCRRRGATALGLFFMGFISFPMPEFFPKHYWLFHSLWHVCLAAGYYELYSLIECENSSRRQNSLRRNEKMTSKPGKHQLHRVSMPKALPQGSLDVTPERVGLTDAAGAQAWVGLSTAAQAAGGLPPCEAADSDASAGTDFEDAGPVSYSLPQPAPAVSLNTPGKSRVAGKHWTWLQRPSR